LNVVETVATALGETEEVPLQTIAQVVRVLGQEEALALLAEALKIEAEGGLQIEDGTRRRSPGGVYFKLVKNKASSRQRWTIFNPVSQSKPKCKPQPISWVASEALSNEALCLPKGKVSTVKVTIIGRPGRVIEKDELIVTTMESGRPPSLPKALPQPPNEPTTYIVYIAMKQWRKVRRSIRDNPEDKLIVEGYPVFDRRIGEQGTMTIYAQSTTTKLIQQTQHEKQKAGAK
jgi:hypothetical protein